MSNDTDKYSPEEKVKVTGLRKYLLILPMKLNILFELCHECDCRQGYPGSKRWTKACS